MPKSIPNRNVALIAAAAGAVLLLIDQATQIWAQRALPISEPFRSCNPATCYSLVTSWLVLKRSTSLPYPVPGEPLISYGILAILCIALVVVILRRGILYPIHAMVMGVLIGGIISTAIDYATRGEIEKFIAVNYAGQPHAYFDLGIIAFVAGGTILLVGVLTGAVRPFGRSQRPKREGRKAIDIAWR